MTEARKITEKLCYEYLSLGKTVKIYEQADFDSNNLDEISEKLNKIRKEYENKYSSIFLHKVREYEHYGEGSWDTWYWMGERLETEEEMNIRKEAIELEKEDGYLKLLAEWKKHYG